MTNFLRGQRIKALCGEATVLPDIDFETYSEAGYLWSESLGKWQAFDGAPQNKKGLRVVGLDNYAKHPSTEVLMLSYDLKDGQPARQWVPGMPPPQDLFGYLQAGGLIEAHNVAFEWRIWEHVCRKRMGWPELRPEQVRCSMAKSRAACYPGGLDLVAKVCGSPVQKDPAGGPLMKFFSNPRNPTKKDARRRNLPQDDPAKWQGYLQYNRIDIQAEAQVSMRTPDLVGQELEWWLEDHLINRRGVAVNLQLVEDGIELIRQAQQKYAGEFQRLTGIDSPTKLQQFKDWLGLQGIYAASLDEEAVDDLLTKVPAEMAAVRRALEVRGLMGSASVKKLYSIRLRANSDHRLCDLFVYHGARTGRPTGEGPQPTNLPQGDLPVVKCSACGGWQKPGRMRCFHCGASGTLPSKAGEWNPDAVEQAVRLLRTRSLELIEECFGHAMKMLAGCLRAAFVARPGHRLVSSDFNSIEAVGLAMLAGEQWRIDLFRTHGKIYEMSAAKISGVPFDEMMKLRGYDMTQPNWWEQDVKGPHHPLRKTLGKVGELAGGYQGWTGAWKAFGAADFMSEEEMKDAILAWRKASPAIVHFWGGQLLEVGYREWVPHLFGCEGMFIQAFTNPRTWCHVLRLDGTRSGVSYVSDGVRVYCRLPSGRYIPYHNVQLLPSDRKAGTWSITFEGFNTNPKNGPVGWITMETWGGRLVENVNQAACRDIQTPAILRAEAAGYPVVLHVYDEIVSEVPYGYGDVKHLESLMMQRQDWYRDWPVRAAGGWEGTFYRKA